MTTGGQAERLTEEVLVEVRYGPESPLQVCLFEIE
jgi:hypothetical protein